MLLKLTKLLLAPTLTDADQDREDQFDSARLIPERRADFGASPFLFASAFCQVRGPHILRDRRYVAEAETCFRQALDITHRQHAKSWELLAAMSLSQLWQQGKRAEARTLLAPVYGWFMGNGRPKKGHKTINQCLASGRVTRRLPVRDAHRVRA